MPLGASILDLLPIPPGTQSAIPSGLRSFLERFAAVDLTSSTTTGATFHYGTLLPMLEDTGIEDAVRGWSIEGAGFDRGVRFQLAATRGPTVNNIEPQPAQFQIDLFLEQVSIVVPALKAARLIPGAGTTPAHLEPDPASSEVRLVGDAILRITTNGLTGWAGPFLADFPDPLVPGSPTGAVASMQFVPPHFSSPTRRSASPCASSRSMLRPPTRRPTSWRETTVRTGLGSPSTRRCFTCHATRRWWAISCWGCATCCWATRSACRASCGWSGVPTRWPRHR